MLICFYDLDLDPMTLINESDQTILKMYLHTKMNFLGEGFQKLRLEYYTEMRPNASPRTSRVVKTPSESQT